MRSFPTYPSAPSLCHLFFFLRALSVDKYIPVKHPGDEPVALDLLPCLLGLSGELEDHRQCCQSCSASPRFVSSQSHRGKGGFDHIG